MSYNPIEDQPDIEIDLNSEETVDCCGKVRTAKDYKTRRDSLMLVAGVGIVVFWCINFGIFLTLLLIYQNDQPKFITFTTIFSIIVFPVVCILVLNLYGCMRNIYKDCCWCSI